jgi:hypothetical protein
MPTNTTVTNPGVPVEYQNPLPASSISVALDSEVVGTDQVSGTQLTREFVVPVESVSGQSALAVLVDLMGQALVELKRIRVLMESEALPDLVDELNEAILADDESDTEESQGS